MAKPKGCDVYEKSYRVLAGAEEGGRRDSMWSSSAGISHLRAAASRRLTRSLSPVSNHTLSCRALMSPPYGPGLASFSVPSHP